MTLFDALLSHSTIITPNRRLAAKLHELYYQHQLNQGLTCWTTPRILPLTTWMETEWFAHGDTNVLLLTSFQEQLIWEKIIKSSKDYSLLLQHSETAKLAI